MTRRGNRPRTGSSPILDGSKLGDPRARQTMSAGLDETMVAPPFYIDATGRLAISLDPRGPLALRSQGTLDLNVGENLEVVTGSPPRLNAIVPNAKQVFQSFTTNLTAADDISYAEVLMSEAAPGDDAVPLFNDAQSDWVYSEIVY